YAGLWPEAHQYLAELDVSQGILGRDGFVELVCGDDAELHEHITKPIATIDDRCERDAPVLEVDLPELPAIGDAEAPGFATHCQQLQDVRETCLTKASTNGHQRISSMARPGISCQSQITRSLSTNNGSAARSTSPSGAPALGSRCPSSSERSVASSRRPAERASANTRLARP